MINSQKSVLNKLLVKESELNEKLLVEILEEFVRLEEESGNLIFTEKFDRLNSQQKLVVVSLAMKAKHRLKKSTTEKLKPKELEELSGLPGNTVRPALKELKTRNIFTCDTEGYWIPNANLYKAKNFIVSKLKSGIKDVKKP